MFFQKVQPDGNILGLQVHSVISIGCHHSSGLITDQRIHIQVIYLLIIRKLRDFFIPGFDAFVGNLISLPGALRGHLHDRLQVDHRIGLQLLQMLYCLPVSLHERFHRTGSHLINADHQIDLGKLLLG